MKIREYYDKHAYQILLTFLPTMACIIILNEMLHLKVSSLIVSILALLWTIVIRIFDYNKKQIVVIIAVVTLILLIVGLVIYNLDAVIQLKDEFVKIAKKEIRSQDISAASLLLIDLCLLICFSIPIYVLQKLKATRSLCSIALIIFIVGYGLKGKLLPLYGIIYALLYILLVLWETFIIRFIRHREIDSSRIMPYLAPLLILYIFIAANMPVSDKPVTLHTDIINGIKDAVTTLYSDIRYWMAPNNGEYDVNMLGYSEDADFEGISEGKEKISLKVTSRKPLGQTMYLRGNWKNIYTGQGWKEDVESTDIFKQYPEDKLDWAELMYAMYRYDRFKTMDDLVCIDSIDITYQDIETSSIFLPLKCTNIKASMALDFASPKNLNFGALTRSGNRYLLSNLKLNYNSDAWRDFVNSVTKYTYSSVNYVDMMEYRKLLSDHNITIGRECYFSNEDILAKRARYIKEQFVELPKELPERITSLTNQITKDCTTTVDKCAAIEAYLKKYTYTLRPPKIPEGKDLVDYFLFDTKEGYCSYFATAMVVMLRTQGIPARYAQGFSFSTGTRPNSTYEISSTSSHAWVEAYEEGLGWMTYDPTPSGDDGKAESYMWGDGSIASTPAPVVNKDGIKISTQDMIKYYEEMGRRQSGEVPDGKGGMQSSDIVKWLIFIILSVVVVSIVMSACYIAARICHNRTLLKRKNSNDNLYAYMTHILYLLTALHCPIETGETLHQYVDRIEGRFVEINPTLNRLEEIYTAIRYSNREVTEEELRTVLAVRSQLLLMVREKKNLYGYVLVWIRYSMLSVK